MKKYLIIFIALIFASCKKEEKAPSEPKIESVVTISINNASAAKFQDEITISAVSQPSATSTMVGEFATLANFYKKDTYKYVYRALRKDRTPYSITFTADGKTLITQVP